MDTYTYLLISALLMLPWASIYFSKKIIRKKMLKASLMGGLAGFIAEYWYFKDYWHPPTMMGHTVISIEDFLFGFSVTGVAVTIYEFVFNITIVKRHRNRKKLFGSLFLAGVLCMVFFNMLLGINSIVVSSTAFLFFTAVMVGVRRDLLKPALFSGLLSIVVILPVYALLFDVVNTDYWDDYWLLARTRLGITVFGHIPVTELCWYFSWGSLAGTAHGFASGNARLIIVKEAIPAVQGTI